MEEEVQRLKLGVPSYVGGADDGAGRARLIEE